MHVSNPESPSIPDWKTWQPEIHATLVFVIQNDQILLIEKLRGIGQGKINGPGGKIDPGESSYQGAIREAEEELHIRIQDAEKAGELWFCMTDIPDIHCHVYRATQFEGVPTATDEAIPRWTPLKEIPFERMWADDAYWLPQMIKGAIFDARFVFEGEQILHHDVRFHCSDHWRGEPYQPHQIQGTNS